MGKEFYNTDMQRLVNKHGINHYSTSVMKASNRRAVQSHAKE